MSNFDIRDEQIDFRIDRAIIVYIRYWDTPLVGEYRGSVVAVIPYQSEDGKQCALKVAQQIVAANPDCSMTYEDELCC